MIFFLKSSGRKKKENKITEIIMLLFFYHTISNKQSKLLSQGISIQLQRLHQLSRFQEMALQFH